MFDVKQLLDQYLGGQGENAAESSSNVGNFGGLAGGALAGGLVGLLTGTKTGRKIGKNALAYGGTAVLGGLAYKAWRDWQKGNSPMTPQASSAESTTPLPLPPANSPFLPEPGQEGELNRALIRAMIGAAKADGEIDAREQKRIFEHLGKLDLDAETQAFVSEELASPLNLEQIVASATCPETAAEIYAASLLAADHTAPAEKGYLGMLAARMKLEPGLVAHLHANVDEALSSG